MLPTDPKARKDMPIWRGVLRYFPDAIAEVANVSRVGNEQHNPGQPMHWAKEKSTDEADCIVRHLIEAGTIDSDGLRHSAKVAWRALALLQREIENERDTKLEFFQPGDTRMANPVFEHACPDLDQEYPLCDCDHTGCYAEKMGKQPASYMCARLRMKDDERFDVV